MTLTRRFWHAMEHDDIDTRQSFLDLLHLENRRYMAVLIYDPSDNPLVMSTDPATAAGRGKKYTFSTVAVHQNAFDPALHRNLGDFLSSLDDHEGTHAKDFFYTPELMHHELHPLYAGVQRVDEIIDLLYVQAENAAYAHQIRNFFRRGVSPNYRQLIYDNLVDGKIVEREILKNL